MMQRIAMISIFAITSSSALAGGSVIEMTSKSVGAGSVIAIDCAKCPPLKARDSGSGVHGVEVVAMEIDGQNKIIQTDNLMGGTAVRYVKSAVSPLQPANREYAGETVSHSDGGTNVTTQHTINAQSDSAPVIADSGTSVSVSGGGGFNVEEVTPEEDQQDDVDDGSHTSSVDMNDAEHDNVETGNPSEPEVLELRPTQ